MRESRTANLQQIEGTCSIQNPALQSVASKTWMSQKLIVPMVSSSHPNLLAAGNDLMIDKLGLHRV